MKAFLTLFLIFASHSLLALEYTQTVAGTPKIVYREYIATPKECLALLPNDGRDRQVWKCVFVHNASTNAWSFNPAYETKDSGRIASDSDIVFELESHPRGGSVGFKAPTAGHPGYSRMIPYAEMRQILERWSSVPHSKFIFRGTYLAL